MSCSQCRHEFCWKCKGDWAKHGSSTGGFYECKLFDPIKHAELTSLADSSDSGAGSPAAVGAETARFVRSLARVNLHSDSEGIAGRRLGQLDPRADRATAVRSFAALRDFQRFLRFAAVALYFTPESSARHGNMFFLFETLESNVELLTEQVERKADSLTLASAERIIDLCRVRCAQFAEVADGGSGSEATGSSTEFAQAALSSFVCRE